MPRASGTVLAPIPSPKKAAARVALIDIPQPTRTILAECFRQFGVESVLLTENVAGRLAKEKFEACVLRLNLQAGPMVIYGLGGSTQEAMKFSKYGINAVFNEPVERPATLKLVRATQMLVLHEFHRYVRIPVITEISLITNDGRRFTATSQEISAGGMSMKSGEDIAPDTALELSFALLTLPRLWVRATVSWRKPDKTFGVRFDSKDDRRLRIKEWIDAYLEN
jgi:hypothetical protein